MEDAARADSWGGAQGGVALGLHLNLSEGMPLIGGGNSLVNVETGCFFDKFVLRQRCQDGLVEEKDVEVEVRAQIERFSHLFGRPPVYVDGHQHVHIVGFLVPIVARVMGEFGISRTRIPRERVTATMHPWIAAPQRAFFEWVYEASLLALPVFQERNICSTDRFVGLSFQGDAFSIERMWLALDEIGPRETVELMTHCGFACALNHGDAFNASASRDAERVAMMTVEFGKRFQLTSWDAII